MGINSRWEGQQLTEEGIAYFGDLPGIKMASFGEYFKLAQYMDSQVAEARVQAKADIYKNIKDLLEREAAWLKK